MAQPLSPGDDADALPASELSRLEAGFALRRVAVGKDAVVAVRECGAGPALVCLHGIGSGAASWLDVAQTLSGSARVIAWDAPGYGESTALEAMQPSAAHYAERLRLVVDALDLDCFVLAGHSLGSIMAAAATRSSLASRIRRLVLISPARGYGAPEQQQTAGRVRAERLGTLDALGVAGMAASRSGRLLSPHASEAARQWVRWTMAQLHEHGYRQAIELLCGTDLLTLLPPSMPVRVACGALDAVTPPESCAALARRCDVALELLPDAGHASHVEQPGLVAKLLRDALV